MYPLGTFFYLCFRQLDIRKELQQSSLNHTNFLNYTSNITFDLYLHIYIYSYINTDTQRYTH